MSAPSWIKVGAKCICVNTDGISWLRLCPAKGAAYTIASFDGTYIGIGEIRRDDGKPSLWDFRRFRPLISKTIEDDIALFKHLLNTTPVSEDA